jgi:hypothetical protein
MEQDPVVVRVIAALDEVIAYADIDVFTASLHAGRLPAGAARDAARVVANALDAVYQSAAEDLYSPSGAKNCRTVQELLDSYRPAVRAAARAMLATVPPAVKRVVARLKRTYKKASSAVVAAEAALDAVVSRDDAFLSSAAAGDAHFDARCADDAAGGDADEAYLDFAGARGCMTLADLLTCDRSAVRLTAMLTPEPAPRATPPAPKRKR